MEYQKIINILDNTLNQSSKFMTKNCVEKNDDWCRTCNTNSQITFKTTMLKLSLCDHSDAYILVKGTITIFGTGVTAAGRQTNRNRKQAIFKSCAPFTHCITEINNTKADNAKDLDDVKLMHNFKEYSKTYSNTSENLW